MNHLSLMTVAGAASLLLMSATHAQSDNGSASSAPPGDARRGHATYLRLGCYQCHGTSGQGGGKVGPKIAPDPLLFGDYMHQLRGPRATMPVYTAAVLPDRDAADIYAYLTSIPEPPSATNLSLLKEAGQSASHQTKPFGPTTAQPESCRSTILNERPLLGRGPAGRNVALWVFRTSTARLLNVRTRIPAKKAARNCRPKTVGRAL